MTSPAVLVLVTTPTAEVAHAVARTLVEERLAACGNVVAGMVRSVYRWQGAVAEADEVLLMLKTQRARVPALTARVRELHPYEVPEVIALPIEGGLDAYLAWIEGSTLEQENQ